jgi:1,3-beta-glucanosyltransferase GAS5
MSNLMTEVYSGGLMYEYTMEENGFGIVQLSGKNGQGTRSELPEFASYSIALANNPAPTNAAFTSTSNSVPCPTRDSNWMVDSTLLPAIPNDARAFFANGAGKGPGLNGPGSQNAGGTSTGDAAPGSGSATGTPNAAGLTRTGPVEKAPFVIAGMTIGFMLLGTLML